MQSDSSEGAPMVRTALLTIFLIALGVGLALPQTAARLGDVETYRRAVPERAPAGAPDQEPEP
ncbi:MAG: hypothetical protein ACJ76J_17350 [Thermoanaerobaculia bacterium]